MTWLRQIVAQLRASLFAKRGQCYTCGQPIARDDTQCDDCWNRQW